MKILLAGGTGLVGSELIKVLTNNNKVDSVTLLVRKSSENLSEKVKEVVVDYDQIEKLDLKSYEAVFCCLGTTVKKSKSKKAYLKVDYEYPLQLAKNCKRDGVRIYGIVTAMGADPNSIIFYNKTKGKVEEDIKSVGIDQLGIFRPSMLLGDRKEFRFGEKIAKIVMLGFDFMIPKKFKAIQAEAVALAMNNFLMSNHKGTQIMENQDML
jgi:uncharacterized protein YbjT (DUF2867 family)